MAKGSGRAAPALVLAALAASWGRGSAKEPTAAGCPAPFPYQSATLSELCYTHASYATAGSGPCGSWCTFDAAVGSGCGDNSERLCTRWCDANSVVPATQAACEEAAEAAGLSKGCGGSAFAGAYSGNGGCYTYTEGDYQGCAFWSSAEATDAVLGDGKERVCLPWPRYDGSIHWSPPPEIASYRAASWWSRPGARSIVGARRNDAPHRAGVGGGRADTRASTAPTTTAATSRTRTALTHNAMTVVHPPRDAGPPPFPTEGAATSRIRLARRRNQLVLAALNRQSAQVQRVQL